MAVREVLRMGDARLLAVADPVTDFGSALHDLIRDMTDTMRQLDGAGLIGEEMEEGWEGCLSVPGMRGLVPRHRALRYSGFDQYGARIERSVSGFHARVVQHETDHLFGILYPMRIRDLRHFGYADVLFPQLATRRSTATTHA